MSSTYRSHPTMRVSIRVAPDRQSRVQAGCTCGIGLATPSNSDIQGEKRSTIWRTVQSPASLYLGSRETCASLVLK